VRVCGPAGQRDDELEATFPCRCGRGDGGGHDAWCPGGNPASDDRDGGGNPASDDRIAKLFAALPGDV
jgi:hypothetical protein